MVILLIDTTLLPSIMFLAYKLNHKQFEIEQKKQQQQKQV